MGTNAAELYREDFYAWTRAQAQALRQLAAERWNGPLDLEHLAEEIEDVGSDRQDVVVSQLRRLIVHLLKLEHSPAADPRRKWLISIDDARAEASQRLTPTVRQEVEPELGDIYRHARRQAALELLDFGKQEAAKALPVQCPYTLDQLLDDGWLPANRHGLIDDLP